MLRLHVDRFWSAALLTVALVVGLTGVARSQISDPRMWMDSLEQGRNGIKIRQGHHVEWQRASYRNPSNGKVLVVWSDCRTGNRDLYGQLLAPDGHQLWEPTGKRLVTFPYRQEDPEVVVTSDNYWLIAWNEFRLDSTGDVFAQKFDDNGNPQWLNTWGDHSGVVVDTFHCPDPPEGCQCAVNEVTVRAVSDGQGGAIIAWEDNRRGDPGDIFAQRVNSSGQTVFGGPGGHTPLWVTDLPSDQVGITADAGDNGSMVLAWQDNRNPDNQDIYAAKVTPSGGTPWGANGRLVCGADGPQKAPKICPDGTGGCYVAWVDERSGGMDPPDDIYIQRMDANGNPQFASDGIAVCNLPYNQQDVRVAVSLNGGNQDGCLIAWQDMRVNGDIKEVYVQKVNAQGTFLWDTTGVKVCGNAGSGDPGQTRDNVRLVSDFSGGLLCAWEDTRDSDNDLLNCDLYAARVLSNGNLASGGWGGQCGRLVASGTLKQNQPLLRADAGTGMYVIYDDYRTGSQTLRYQKMDIATGNLDWNTDSVLVSGLDWDAVEPLTVAMSNGRTGVVWKDSRALVGNALYYQIVDSTNNGRTERTMNGDTLVPDNSGGPALSQEAHQICPDGNGGFFCTFEDNRTSIKRIRLTRVNSAGDLACSRAGQIVYEDADCQDQAYAYCAPDGAGGCYVAWSNYNNSFLIDVWMMRMDQNCQPMWPQAVRLTNTGDDDMMKGLVSNADGAIAVWQSGGYQQFNISTGKVLADGTIAFDTTVCNADNEQGSPCIVADGAGGAYYAWDDKRLQGQYDQDIYAQHLDAQGHEVWQHNGVPVIHLAAKQDKPVMALDGEHNLTIIWRDYRDGVSLNLWGQKLNTEGTRLWPSEGRPVCLAEGDQTDAVILSEWGNGIWAAWTDSRVPYTDVYGSHWYANGQMANCPNGQLPNNFWNADSGGVFCDAYQWQDRPSISSDGIAGVVAAWEDKRASGKEPLINIWVQRINDFASSVREIPTVAIPQKPELFQNYPNPFNPSTRIQFSIPSTQMVSVEVFNSLGQKVGTLVDKVMSAGKYEIAFENQRLASGMYFYRLKTANFVDVKKMIMMK